MRELSNREEKIYAYSRQMDSLLFKLFYLKYAYEGMINSLPDDFHPAMDLTEQQNVSCDKLHSAMVQAQNEFGRLMKSVQNDYDDLTDKVPF